jgi:hypothetical protein
VSDEARLDTLARGVTALIVRVGWNCGNAVAAARTPRGVPRMAANNGATEVIAPTRTTVKVFIGEPWRRRSDCSPGGRVENRPGVPGKICD